MEQTMTRKQSIFREAPLTMALIIINVAIFAALNAMPQLGELLLLNPETSLIRARPWTLLTVFFSQEVHIHLLLNMGFFFVFGKEMEKNHGSAVVLLTYVICGFLGSLTFPFFAPVIGWTGPVVGASAAVWGIVAAVSVLQPKLLVWKHPAKHYVLALFVGNAALLLMNPAISIGAAAHAMGIAAGLVCGYVFKRLSF